jgi:crotonobetainyl-CoA:carnitine CoA-transferase CaiB-like acyl-CoA transferase
VRLSKTPISYRRRAPRIGEHDGELLRAPASVPGGGMAVAAERPRSDGVDGPPLAGVKIVDLMWSVAGPAASRVLADYGATVVRIESTKRIDVARTLAPFHQPSQSASPGPENSGQQQNMSAGKLGMTLDLARDEGRAVLRDLVRWADVVMEAYTPHAMPAWGCGYEALCGLKPDIIMLSTCLMGQTGPLANYAGFGNLASALSGFYDITGWPDRKPSGPFGAYSDTVSPRFTVAAVLAALDHRRRTGEGQHIDQSQAEATLHFLAPALLDYAVNGRVHERIGNRDPQMAPHGVYPAAGDDRWVAIAVDNDARWGSLCEVMGQAELARDARFATLAARLEHHDELEAIVSAWTRQRDMHQIEVTLQLHGVAASAVQNSRELYGDAQLWHRGHFVELKHPIHGTTTVESSRFRLSRTPARYDLCGPTLGRDNMYVLETILGYDAARIAELAAAGVLE